MKLKYHSRIFVFENCDREFSRFEYSTLVYGVSFIFGFIMTDIAQWNYIN